MSSPIRKSSYEENYNLNQRFKNLENPLKFIQNAKIINLQNNYDRLKSDLKKGQETISQFSKSIYKKVISRDNQYKFNHKVVGNEFDHMYDFNQKYSKTGQIVKTEDRVKKEDLEKKFKHGEIISLQQKKQRLRQEKEIPLTFKHVKLIQTPEFDQLRDVQFYSILKGYNQQKDSGHTTNEIDNKTVNEHLGTFKHKILQQSQYHTKNSYNFLFNCDKELVFWKLAGNIFEDEKKSDDQVLSKCAFLDTKNISIFDMFDFASKNIQTDDIEKFYKLKIGLEQKMGRDKADESIQEKYNDAKKRFQEMKENKLKSKNQRLPAKFTENVAQTNDQMQEKDFEDYFVQDAKNIFTRLQKLNEVRDRIINDEQQTFNVMATNIGLEIGKQLFKLLLIVLKGEEFSNYSQFLNAENQTDVERKVLELIYLEFKNFKQYQVNGISKVDIIKKYLEEREKNQRFYETYLFKNEKNPPSKTPTKIKTNTTIKTTKKK